MPNLSVVILLSLIVAITPSLKAMLFSLITAMEPATVAITAMDTVRPSSTVSQTTRHTMSKEEAPSIPQLAAMAANVTAAMLPLATEVRLESMATTARPTVATLTMVATLANNHTDTLMEDITEESEMKCREEKKR